jgi:hypothetical protein
MNNKLQNQNHLNIYDTVNLGSYYTNLNLVNIVYKMLKKYIMNVADYTIIDTSCGYGNFLQYNDFKCIGSDIDSKAIEIAKNYNPHISLFNYNSLYNISRFSYKLKEQDKIIIVGNPPYNDKTSIIKNNIKSLSMSIDEDLKARDLGISFLLSYNKLQADFVCVLHPLSYLIKKSNFNLLGEFKNNYKLIDSIIVSSNQFDNTSKNIFFPIIIGFYKKDNIGMDYNFIENYLFKTLEGNSFKLKDFDNIGNYISKYPNQKSIKKDDAIAFFWTMRDINALKRSKTYVNSINYNTIYITKDTLEYYCYVDIFKKYIKYIPYYLGNCDIMINNKKFQEIKDIFKIASLINHPNLHNLIDIKRHNKDIYIDIDNYFKNLLGDHFVY